MTASGMQGARPPPEVSSHKAPSGETAPMARLGWWEQGYLGKAQSVEIGDDHRAEARGPRVNAAPGDAKNELPRPGRLVEVARA